ncbi:MAG: prenyltransferase/squalene oxidase repeat-containing protein, partial [Nitrospirota bacterium]|nr:prenyltransferase/squalene oxidase repeat-containing protein [Nitrospirota bacterium]
MVPKLRQQRAKKTAPSLKLVSHNLHPVVSPDTSTQRSAHLGHMESLESALQKGEQWLLSKQDLEQGFRVEELEADTTLTSEYVMLRRFLGLVDPERERKAACYLLQAQLDDGGWPIFSGGPADISATVKAYFALKLAGMSSDEPVMQRARDLVLQQGGVVQANVFTKITLALFGQYDWRGIPCMPAEIFLAP